MSADTEKLHTVVHDGNGPPGLIVHGALGSRSYWDDNIAALAEVCQPVVIELWGHGRSPSPADTNRYRGGPLPAPLADGAADPGCRDC
ncbi:alpha/beta fold hydrolase [Candidatus Poriferisodalis sp.]|uniref:alpha/beta fold hydrolase n=1 Tax=Candidatus Poriferisodalis sp. TaxID=3101277 RepID=UPI003B026837